ncbi:MAG: N-6 DNA methylase [Streptococcus parasanguinis]
MVSSGESQIRRYILENDLLEAIIALPGQFFYNTGIGIYIWIYNKTTLERQNKVQFIDATEEFVPFA